MSIIVTGSLVITGNTVVGPGVVTEGLDFYFDVGNLNCFDYINNNSQYVSNLSDSENLTGLSSFIFYTGSSTASTPFTSSFNPNFGGCILVSRSTFLPNDNLTLPSIILQNTNPALPSFYSNNFGSKYLNGRRELTLGIWHYRAENTLAATQGNFFWAGTSTVAATRLFDIYFTNSGLKMSARVSSSFNTAYSPNGVDGRWNYYTFTFKDGTYTLYANGVPGTSMNSSSPTLGTGCQNFYIGGSVAGPNSTKMVAYLGPIQIYGRALTQKEVAQNYHMMKSRFGIYT